MVHILGSAILMVITLHFFSVNYTLTDINRVYFGLYKGVIETSVMVSDKNGKELDTPYFSIDGVRESLTNYCIKEVKPICNYSYRVGFRDAAGKVTLTSAVKVIINITFYPVGWKEITRQAIFQIEKGVQNYG